MCDELLDENRTRGLLTSDRYPGRELRSAAVTGAVSAVAGIAGLRDRVTALVRLWARTRKKCVIEGRDIGTAIFPAAPVKFYLTATPEVRATRRVAQERRDTYEQVPADVIRRDRADMTRSASPLEPAADAVTIDTTSLTLRQVVKRMIAVCRSRGVTVP
ncbi:hypothetical protein GCM10022243_34640 [Saccharothrix violaceirubra]|uniref:(d)CMP kinase n=1 Tax=Saccharothrix violaceirubra TaxID=413306 RepID=A0A7W7WWN0_9PSEU|nr:(d)CMP kinase [Saccharothrix violaceirubra]MBB4966515.1 cytidylate kinase [Saccharothrix violaceirubra]